MRVRGKRSGEPEGKEGKRVGEAEGERVRK